MPNDKLEDFILHHRDDFDAEAPAPGLWDRIEDVLDSDEDHGGDIESFIATHRDAFDTATPPPQLEARILRAVGQSQTMAAASPAPPLTVSHRRRRLMPMLGIAASVLFLIVAAFMLGNNRGYRAAEGDRIAEELQRIAPDYLETERYFQNEIASQTAKVRQVSDDPALLADLEEIDRATAEVRASLLEVPVSQRPELVEELIRMHRTKLDILVRIQRHLPPTGPAAAPRPQTETSHGI